MDAVRRRLLRSLGATAAALWLAPPAARAAARGERRFVFVIQRGAADGLNTLIPYADPAYARQRGALAIAAADAHRLDGLFALHPALEQTARMAAAGQALGVHAVATPYRERSHFDGQNVLESGASAPYALADGWLNRLIGLLPPAADDALALAPTVPLALRGPAPVSSYAPSALPPPADDLLARVSELYAADAQLHALWRSALQTRAVAGTDGSARRDAACLGQLAARLLAEPDGPRIAMLETGGWDTHGNQNPRLAAQLKQLDALLAALRDGLGPAWQHSVVLVATEFGRTVAVNGTRGTDHGTGAAALLVGGALRGGRVLADWPGLQPAALHDGRDLRATTPLPALIASVTAQVFELDPQRVAATLFPQTPGLRLIDGLVG